jgi:hypothetical protein
VGRNVPSDIGGWPVATTEYILDDGDVGAVFPEIDGYVLSLVRSRSPNNRGALSPNWNETHFILRDAQSTRNLFCLDSIGRTPLMIGGAMYYLINAAIPFHGELTLVSVPLGSEWELTLSDVYVAPRQPLHTAESPGNGMWTNYPSYKHNAARSRQKAREPRPLQLPPPALRIAAPIIEGERVPIER